MTVPSRQHRDFASVIHPQLADDHFGVVGHVVEAERCSDQIVEIPPRFPCAAFRRHQRRDHFLGGGLTRRAGDRDQQEWIALSNRMRELLQRFCGIRDVHDSFVPRDRFRNACHNRTARGLQRLRNELMSVEPLALDREEDRVGLDFAAVDDDGGDFDVGILDDFAVRHLGELADGQRGHCRPPCGIEVSQSRGLEVLHRETAQPRNPATSVLSPGPAAFRPRRSLPFPHDCLAITIRPPTLKRTDGAGTEHLLRCAES